MSWSEALLLKARAIHAEIAALQNYLAAGGPPGAEGEAFLANHYAMLDDLYLNQIPFAQAAVDSDLFLNYRGPSDARARAGLGAVDRLFGNVRTQVAVMTRSVLGAEAPEGAEKPAPVGEGGTELIVSAYAPGRYVGFALPDGEGPGPIPVQPAVPSYGAAMRQSLRNLGLAAQALPEADPGDRLAEEIDDPQVRDATLGALKKLLPYRDKAVEALELRGRALALEAPATLDREGWHVAHRLMAQPVANTEPATFTGHILQIDYELRRFELRWLDDPNLSTLRCAYPEALAARCEGLAKRKVIVSGPTAFRRGRPRLLQVESVTETA